MIYIDFNIPESKDRLAIAMNEKNWAGIKPSQKYIKKLIFDDFPDAYNLEVKYYISR